jgi:hypothetical protein
MTPDSIFVGFIIFLCVWLLGFVVSGFRIDAPHRFRMWVLMDSSDDIDERLKSTDKLPTYKKMIWDLTCWTQKQFKKKYFK